jgi:hypothetical protein
MKKIGIFIFAIGFIITIITGFNFVTREKIVDIGEVKISRNKNHSVAWSPILGIVVMTIGGGVLLLGYRSKNS